MIEPLNESQTADQTVPQTPPIEEPKAAPITEQTPTNPLTTDQLLTKLSTKAGLKQTVYRNVKAEFEQLKDCVRSIQNELSNKLSAIDPNVQVDYNERGEFDIELKFSGDTLVFSMHTNIFFIEGVDEKAFGGYLAGHPERGYCALINIYNFMSDSYKYSRLNDIGILAGRIFINQEDHFFVEGRKSLGRTFHKFGEQVFNPASMEAIIRTAMFDAIDTDLMPPAFEQVQMISLQQKLNEVGSAGLHVGKRLGYQIKGSTR